MLTEIGSASIWTAYIAQTMFSSVKVVFSLEREPYDNLIDPESMYPSKLGTDNISVRPEALHRDRRAGQSNLNPALRFEEKADSR